MKVAVFAASSSLTDQPYIEAAAELGHTFAINNIDGVFGGGGMGLMSAFADALLAGGGSATGVIPQFMMDEGWGHGGLTNMIITPDMSERKRVIAEISDAAVALPGGVGTLEELTEVITLKQLGLFNKPVIILNVNGYYDPLLRFFDQMVDGRFMRPEHRAIWQTVEKVDEVVPLIKNYSDWHANPKVIAPI